MNQIDGIPPSIPPKPAPQKPPASPQESTAEVAQNTLSSDNANSLKKIELEASDITQNVEEATIFSVTNFDGLWECVERQEFPQEKGFIYTFHLRESCNIWANILPDHPKVDDDTIIQRDQFGALRGRKTFPATEQIGRNPLHQLTDVIDKMRLKHQQHFAETNTMLDKVEGVYLDQHTNDIMKELGYTVEMHKDGSIYATYPDHHILELRWEKIRQSHPEYSLPPLKIQPSNNAAGDEEFLEAFKAANALLSTGEEFVHDQQFHVVGQLLFMIKHPHEYTILRNQAIDQIQKQVDQIKRIGKIVDKKLEKPKSEEDRLYLERVKKHLPYALVIPAIIADQMNASWKPEHLKLMISMSEIERGFAIQLKNVYEDYFKKRFAKEIEEFKKEGIEFSIPWLYDELASLSLR